MVLSAVGIALLEISRGEILLRDIIQNVIQTLIGVEIDCFETSQTVDLEGVNNIIIKFTTTHKAGRW